MTMAMSRQNQFVAVFYSHQCALAAKAANSILGCIR